MKKIFIRFGFYAALAILMACKPGSNQKYEFAFQDISLSVDERAADLISHMTLDEKIAQLSHLAPGIERLGVAEYGPIFNNPLKPDGHPFISDEKYYMEKRPWENREFWKEGDCFDGGYWNEALHGVARSGLATVFPQAIGLGSTWNPDLLKQIATAISDEARVHHAVYGKKLTYWSPTINMLRDPRWGRTEEGYSEDPYLQSLMGVAFVQGMQGEDSNYLKTIATVKHFVANNSEINRHDGSSDIDERQLREYYFPAFKAAVESGGVYSVMAAYNALNGTPACVNNWLLNKVLRDEWRFEGFVVSDCGAISDIVHGHQYETDPEKAVALAVKAGTDMECETCEKEQLLYDKYLPGAVAKGYISEAEIDKAVAHIFKARFKLGEFDPMELNPFNNIPESKLDCEEHRELALEAARQSIVLLKNQKQTLPLNAASVKRIALIGPNANKAEFGGYSGSPSIKITPLDGLRMKIDSAKITYVEGCLLNKELEGGIQKAVEAAKNAEVAVVVLGTGLHMANEGKDRTELNLPEVQVQLLKKVYEVNKTTVLVLMSGFPLAIQWAEDNIPAILNVWYPGQSGGLALAETLFGEYNPGGKIPVTFYKDASQLPPITDYDITKGRTYWYFKGEVLYPFGHGLSYTTFNYDSIQSVEIINIENLNDFKVEVNVTNTGLYNGDEVVQLYIRNLQSAYLQPRLKLRKFQRINISKGATEKISFKLSKEDFSFWNPDKEDWDIEKGNYQILIGASSENTPLSKTILVQ